MATAFQPDAFQHDAFQIEEAQTGGAGSASTTPARRQVFKYADLVIKESPDILRFKIISDKVLKAKLSIKENADIFQGWIRHGRQVNLSIKEKRDFFRISFELGLNLQRDEEEFLIMLLRGKK